MSKRYLEYYHKDSGTQIVSGGLARGWCYKVQKQKKILGITYWSTVIKTLDLSLAKEVYYGLNGWIRKCPDCKNWGTKDCPNSSMCYSLWQKPFYKSKDNEL